MNRTFLSAFALLAVALSMAFASGAAANNCNLPVGDSEETAWAWGYNGDGELGDGTNDDRSTPVRVQNLSGSRPSPPVEDIAWRSRATARSGPGVGT
jgi:hypothetical protein